MKIPIEIKRKDYTSNDFSITATTNYSCNYNCKYCYNKTHNSCEYLDLITLQQFIDKNVKNNYNIDLYLIGGETTLHPKLLDFSIKFNNKKIGGMNIFTNLSANINLYKKLIDNNVTIIATYHLCNNNTQTFIDKIIELNKYALDNMLKVNIMFEKNNIINSLYVYDKLKSVVKQLELCIQHKTKYSLDEIKQFEMRHKTEHYDIDPYIVTYLDNTHEELYYNDLADSEKFNVKNWLCNAGYCSFYINVNGDIYPCESHFFDNIKPIGNISSAIKYGINFKKTICTCFDCCNFHTYKKKIFF